MSIRLMNQVFELSLRPIEKLALLVLADMANEKGICWPSLKYAARRASISVRTMQRTISSLEKDGLLLRQTRFRTDGSQTSSELLVLPNATKDGKVSPPAVAAAIPPATIKVNGGDEAATPLTTTNSLNNHNNTPTGLIFPQSFTASSIQSAEKLLSELPNTDAQILLDETTARISLGKVSSPLSYLRSLIKSHADGSFVPELADQIAKKRLKKLAEKPKPIVTSKLSSEQGQKHLQKIRQALLKGNKSC
jgi:hypothetical protein